jgi:hypothetical protein
MVAQYRTASESRTDIAFGLVGEKLRLRADNICNLREMSRERREAPVALGRVWEKQLEIYPSKVLRK